MPELSIDVPARTAVERPPRWWVALGPGGGEIAGHEASLRISARGGVVTLESASRRVHLRAPLLELLERVRERIRVERPPGLPFGHGLVGYLGYGILDPAERAHAAPDAWLALPASSLVRADADAPWRAVTPRGVPDGETLLTELSHAYPTAAAPLPPAREPDGGVALDELAGVRSDLGRAGFESAVRRALEWIAAGDVYQVNLSHRLSAALPGSAYGLFRTLLERHPAPHAAYLDTGPVQVLCNSPEQFLRRDGETVSIRPIKGTRPRSADPGRDAALARELRASAKDRAEHVMIVDLVRNDLGRVARTGSVEVEALCALQSFPTVHHLVSTVRARVDRGTGLGALLAATYPCGSVTGAPKIRSMQVIRELEPTPRGPYTGAIGAIESSGDLHLAVAIRTAVVRDGEVEYRCGGGIVADSDPTEEWRETLTKAEAFLGALRHEAARFAAQRRAAGGRRG